MKNISAVESELGRWNPVDLAYLENLTLHGDDSSIRLDGLFQRRANGWPNVKQPLLRVTMEFEGVTQFHLKEWNGVIQVMGFDILAIERPGWEHGPTLQVLDYEDAILGFFAVAGSVLSASWAEQ